MLGSLAALAPITLMACAISLLGPQCLSTDSTGRELVTLWSAALWAKLIYAAGVLLVLLLVAACIRWRGRPHPAAVAVSAFLCFGLWGMAGFMSLRHPWLAGGPATIGPDGAAYRTGGDGDTTRRWIVRDVERSWYRVVAELVVSGRNGARVIRPAGDIGDGIRFDASGRMFLVEGGEVLVAFDPHATPRRPPNTWDDSLYLCRAMPDDEVSPFALLSRAGRGDDQDVRAVLDTIAFARDRTEKGERVWMPPERHLLAALDDPNPWVAETAAKFVREGGATLYPSAMERLRR